MRTLSNPFIEEMAAQLLEDLEDPAILSLHEKHEILIHYLTQAYDIGLGEECDWWRDQDANSDDEEERREE